MKVIKVLIFLLLISSCKKVELINDRNVSFTSDSSNVFGTVSDSSIIHPNIEYKLNINQTIIFDRQYTGTSNNFKLTVIVDDIKYSLNNDYFFKIK